MFNKRKAENFKYVSKKMDKNINNLRYLTPSTAEKLFEQSGNESWACAFADKVYANPELIDVIEKLPIDTRKVVARNILHWHGDLITKFDEELRNDPTVAWYAIDYDYVDPMPTTTVERVINRDGDTGFVKVNDFSTLKRWYELFPSLGEEARIKILMNKSFDVKTEEEKYFIDAIPESIKNDPELVKKIIRKVPFIYPTLPENVKKDLGVIHILLNIPYSYGVGEVIETLSEEEKKKLLSEYRIGWYSGIIPKALDFAFKNKEYLKVILENNPFDKRVVELIDKELLKDKEVAELCLSKLKSGYYGDEKDLYTAFPKEVFSKAENVITFIKGIGYRYNNSETIVQMLDGLSAKEFAKVAEAVPGILVLPVKHEKQKLLESLASRVNPDDAQRFANSAGGFAKLSEKVQKTLFIIAPSKFYYEVEKKGREYFVEAALQNPAVIDCIRDPQLRSDVLIEYTTIKYLDKKQIKITSEEDLDKLIEKVKGLKPKATKATAKAKKPTTVKKDTKGKNTKK